LYEFKKYVPVFWMPTVSLRALAKRQGQRRNATDGSRWMVHIRPTRKELETKFARWRTYVEFTAQLEFASAQKSIGDLVGR
jgi:hypothetical protein